MTQKSEMKLMMELRGLRDQPGELPVTCAYRAIAEGSTVRAFYTSLYYFNRV